MKTLILSMAAAPYQTAHAKLAVALQSELSASVPDSVVVVTASPSGVFARQRPSERQTVYGMGLRYHDPLSEPPGFWAHWSMLLNLRLFLRTIEAVAPHSFDRVIAIGALGCQLALSPSCPVPVTLVLDNFDLRHYRGLYGYLLRTLVKLATTAVCLGADGGLLEVSAGDVSRLGNLKTLSPESVFEAGQASKLLCGSLPGPGSG